MLDPNAANDGDILIVVEDVVITPGPVLKVFVALEFFFRLRLLSAL